MSILRYGDERFHTRGGEHRASPPVDTVDPQEWADDLAEHLRAHHRRASGSQPSVPRWAEGGHQPGTLRTAKAEPSRSDSFRENRAEP